MDENEPNVLTQPEVEASPHAETIKGLVAAAVWLAQHPELPEVHANVYVGRFNLKRDEMERLAVTLNADLKDLEERPTAVMTTVGAKVNDRVRVEGSAYRTDLTPQVAPKNLILKECPQCTGSKVIYVGPAEEYEPCDWCDGRGFVLPEPCPVTSADFVTPEAGVLGTDDSDEWAAAA